MVVAAVNASPPTTNSSAKVVELVAPDVGLVEVAAVEA